MIRLTLISLTALSLLGAVIPIPTGPESAFTKTLKPLTNAPLWREALGISNLLGGSIFVTNVVINGTNAPQGNGTPPYLPVWLTTNVLGDSPVYQIDTNKVGVDEVWANALLVTNLQTGGIVLSLTPEGYATNLLRGVGFVYDDGVDITLRDITATTVITNLFVTNLTVLNFITVGGTNVAVVNPTDGYVPVRASTNAFADSVMHITNSGGGGPHNNIIFGPLNKTYIESGVGQTPSIVLGDFVRWSENSQSSVHSGASTWNFVVNDSPGTSLALSNSRLQLTKGASATEVDIYGHQSGAGLTNYAYIATKHTGTNGAAVFDSQSGGSAGLPRPFDFAFNGVTGLRISDSSGTIELENPNNHTIAVNQGASGSTTFTHSGNGTLFIGPGVANLTKNALGVTVPVQTYGYLAQNGTAATSLVQQNSPSVTWTGQGWGTASSTSQTTLFGAYVVPTLGAVTPTARWTMSTVISNTTPSTVFEIDSQGPVVLKGITKAQRDAIVAPSNGMIVNQTDNTPGIRFYENGAWVKPTTVADP